MTPDGVVFRLWAPAAARVDVLLDRPYAMTGNDGWFRCTIPTASAGARYRFRIDGGIDIPDPASAFQPDDIFGPSEVIDHGAYRWRAAESRGRPWHEAVILEAHVGTFTAEGSYRAMADRLDHLAATGFTALELMPVADFPGRFNWGYDGALWYAPDHHYGRPDDLKSLIDESHLRGLMVFLDVVHNHFGPEGNYLRHSAPQFFSSHQTAWGTGIDYTVAEVRAFAIQSCLAWLRDYRFDGLRLDAVHALAAPGGLELLHQLSRTVGEFAAGTGRHIHLVLENDDNLARLLDPNEEPSHGRYRAQWNDDYHHAWHALLTGEHHSYYSDYAAPLAHIARTLTSGFSYQGEASEYRGGRSRGEPSGALSPLAFVHFLQNHDQIGNRALGERLVTLGSIDAIEAALAITLLAPMPPLLFMGEEWGATQPFPYFCDHQGELADAIKASRKRDFAIDYQGFADEIPDPFDEATVRSATLDWSALSTPAARRRLDLVTRLLTTRRQMIVPRLADAAFDHGGVSDDGVLVVQWRLKSSSRLHMLANLSDLPAPYELAAAEHIHVWGEQSGGPLAPWSVRWWIDGR